MVSLVDSLSAPRDQDQFARQSLPLLSDILSCDTLTYHEVWLASGTIHHLRLHRVGSCPPPPGTRFHARLTLAPDPGFRAVLTFSRSTRAFSDVEHDVLSLLRDPLTSALARSREHTDPAAATDGDGGGTVTLTGREREVVALVARGRTNVAIAHELAVSPRTVAKHLEHIYRKLEVAGRAAAVARVLR
ncbi:helix-turn-helix transcriptional regulator [Saccharomonospora saliphila]|uniref:helix-turn-helix transcriptional regulator n=1 Tax=Saccharomonospora saliphila TaxID=369829 RepID=UPI002FBD5774